MVVRCKLLGWESLFKICEKARKGKYRRLALLATTRKIPIGAQSNFIQVQGTSLNLRTGPGQNFEVVKSFKQGTKLMVVGTRKNWLQVKDDAGAQGWVAGWLTKKLSPTLFKKLNVGATKAKPKRLSNRTFNPTSKSIANPKNRPTEKSFTPPRPKRSLSMRLRELKDIWEQGLITNSDYEAKRAELLRSL